MNKNIKTASLLLYIIATIAIIFGLIYLFTPKIMPYHEKVIGMKHNELDPKIAKLFLSMLKGAGGAILSIGISLIMIVRGPFSRGDIWAWKIVMVMTMTALLPLLFVTLSLGLHTPWWLVFIMIILTIIALFISKKSVYKL